MASAAGTGRHRHAGTAVFAVAVVVVFAVVITAAVVILIVATLAGAHVQADDARGRELAVTDCVAEAKAALDNPDLPVDVVRDLLVARNESREAMAAFVPGQYRSQATADAHSRCASQRFCECLQAAAQQAKRCS